jgi:hypothetical protein
MEQPEQAQEPERARAAFNMVALHLAGYTYDQIELFHPADMTPDRLHELLARKLTNLLGEWAAKQHLKVELTGRAGATPKDRSD